MNKKDLKLVFHFHISKRVFNSFYIKAYVFERKCKNMKINSKIINWPIVFILMLSYVTCYQPKIINLVYGFMKKPSHICAITYNIAESSRRGGRVPLGFWKKSKKNKKNSPKLDFQVIMKVLNLVFPFSYFKRVLMIFY